MPDPIPTTAPAPPALAARSDPAPAAAPPAPSGAPTFLYSHCPTCGVAFGVPAALTLAAGGRPVHCPNGHAHPWPARDHADPAARLRAVLAELATAEAQAAALRAELAQRPMAAPAAPPSQAEMRRRYRHLFTMAEEVAPRAGQAPKLRCRFCGQAITTTGVYFRRHLSRSHAAEVAALPASCFT